MKDQKYSTATDDRGQRWERIDMPCGCWFARPMFKTFMVEAGCRCLNHLPSEMGQPHPETPEPLWLTLNHNARAVPEVQHPEDSAAELRDLVDRDAGAAVVKQVGEILFGGDLMEALMKYDKAVYDAVFVLFKTLLEARRYALERRNKPAEDQHVALKIVSEELSQGLANHVRMAVAFLHSQFCSIDHERPAALQEGGIVEP